MFQGGDFLCSAKFWLQEYADRYAELCSIFDRLDALRDKAGPSSSKLTGFPRSPSPATDRIGLVLVQIAELENEAAELARELLEIQRKIYFLEVGNEQQKKVHGGTS